jgi:hypothetical protein
VKRFIIFPLFLTTSCLFPNAPPPNLVTYQLVNQEMIDFDTNLNQYLALVKPAITYGKSHGFGFGFAFFHHH